jgi:hypothetical protein
MMLWLNFFPDEDWATLHEARSLLMLGRMWQEEGYFRALADQTHFAFNYGVSVGLQTVGAWPERVNAFNAYFETYRSGDEYDRAAITHVMACSSHFPGLLAAAIIARQNAAAMASSTVESQTKFIAFRAASGTSS